MVADELIKDISPYIQIVVGIAVAAFLSMIVKEVIKRLIYEGSLAVGCSKREARKNDKCAGDSIDISSASNDIHGTKK